MTSRDFCYWLQGALEIIDPSTLTEDQLKTIKAHLNLVFFHEIDPSYSDDKEVQNKMNQIHGNSDKVTLRC